MISYCIVCWLLGWEVSIKYLEFSCWIFNLILEGYSCNPEFSSASKPSAVHICVEHRKQLLIVSAADELSFNIKSIPVSECSVEVPYMRNICWCFFFSFLLLSGGFWYTHLRYKHCLEIIFLCMSWPFVLTHSTMCQLRVFSESSYMMHSDVPKNGET